MATITVRSFTAHVDNKDDASRQFNIESDVKVVNGNVDTITGGRVTTKDSPNGMDNIATFDNVMSPKRIDIFDLEADDMAVYQAINDFNTSTKAYFAANPATEN